VPRRKRDGNKRKLNAMFALFKKGKKNNITKEKTTHQNHQEHKREWS